MMASPPEVSVLDSACAQLLQQLGVGVAIGWPVQLQLQGANGLARIGADDAVGRAWVEAGLGQQLLQFDTFTTPQLTLTPGPLPLDFGAA